MTLDDMVVAPPSEYRPIPFWSWNEELEPAELCRQIEEMHAAGIGGFFMHARGGLRTPYLGEAWMEATRASLACGNALGMKSWAYDENGWPSGFGNGVVNGMGERFQQKYLRCRRLPFAAARQLELRLGVYTATGAMLADDSAAPDGAEEVIAVFYEINPYYVDNLDATVVHAFLDAVYQTYFDRLTPEERGTLSGFFTDEPQLSRNGAPWSAVLPDEYAAAYGESLPELLPQLFLPLGAYRRTRYRFWRLVSRLFAEHYQKQIYDWCRAHGWKITGHCVMEESYNDQITSNGAVMPQYRYYDIPGMDWLGRHIRPLTTPVQVGSVAAQYGKKQVLSETFAMCGWDVSFAALKWMYQWQMVHGANLLCQHLESYSLRGIRKRDYPASLFCHQPWWPHYRAFNDYVSRIGVLLSEGANPCRVLVLHGMNTAWMHYAGERMEHGETVEINRRYAEALDRIAEELAARQCPFHFGDETLMEEAGSVGDAGLTIGCMSYDCVILPQMANLTRCQKRLLEAFVERGFLLLGVRNTHEPHFYLEGEVADDLPLLQSIRWFDTESEAAAFVAAATGAIRVTGNGAEALHCAIRRYPALFGSAATLYYLVNTGFETAVEFEIAVPGRSLEQFDPATGETTPLPVCSVDGEVRIATKARIAPAGDLLLIARDTPPPANLAKTPEKARKLLFPYGLADLTEPVENLLTLDHCAYEVDGVRYSDHEYVLSIQDRLLALERAVPVRLEFSFRTDDEFPCALPVDLLVERPEQYRISVNGTAVDSTPRGFFADRAFERIPIGGAIRRGENRIVLETVFRQRPEVYECIRAARIFEAELNKLTFDMELESVYLAGAFGVSTPGAFHALPRRAVRYEGDFVLTAQPRRIHLDRIEQSGFPFFAGSIELEQWFDAASDGESWTLCFAEQRFTVAEFEVNGVSAGSRFWPELRIDLPEGAIRAGRNRLRIRLTNSLRNMLGPHHMDEGEGYWICPSSFYKESGVFCSGVPAPWNSAWCFTRFGIVSAETESLPNSSGH